MVMGTREEEDWAGGYLSDDSDFYGEEPLRSDLSDRAANFDPTTYWASRDLELSVIAYTATVTTSMSTLTSTPKPKQAVNMYENDPSGRQLPETVEAFLQRVPPQTTQLMDHGPWIYIANPYASHHTEDRAGFASRGRELLEDYESMAKGIEASMAGKAKGTTTRKLTPLRKQLELDIFALAKDKGCVSGKWMLFPSPSQVNHCWSLVAHGTATGELGHAAKVATDDGSGSARLICIYTENFADMEDVKRLLERLLGMGLVNRNGAMGEGWAIYYKADAYTYLDIMSKNVWGLKPSLYNSMEVLAEGK